MQHNHRTSVKHLLSWPRRESAGGKSPHPGPVQTDFMVAENFVNQSYSGRDYWEVRLGAAAMLKDQAGAQQRFDG